MSMMARLPPGLSRRNASCKTSLVRSQCNGTMSGVGREVRGDLDLKTLGRGKGTEGRGVYIS